MARDKDSVKEQWMQATPAVCSHVLGHWWETG